MKRKNAIYIFIIAVVLAITLYTYSKVNNESIQQANIDFNFDLEIVDINDRLITKNIFIEKNILVFFFNTQCNLCISEIPMIIEQRKDLTRAYNILFISIEPKKELELFFSQYSLSNESDLYIISDEEGILLDFFSITAFPTFLIFDNRGNAIHKSTIMTREMISNLTTLTP